MSLDVTFSFPMIFGRVTSLKTDIHEGAGYDSSDGISVRPHSANPSRVFFACAPPPGLRLRGRR